MIVQVIDAIDYDRRVGTYGTTSCTDGTLTFTVTVTGSNWDPVFFAPARRSVPKRRWCLTGFEDPPVYGDLPTPQYMAPEQPRRRCGMRRRAVRGVRSRPGMRGVLRRKEKAL